MKQILFLFLFTIVGLLLCNGCIKNGERKHSVMDVQKTLKDKDKIWLNELYQQLKERVRQTYVHI